MNAMCVCGHVTFLYTAGVGETVRGAVSEGQKVMDSRLEQRRLEETRLCRQYSTGDGLLVRNRQVREAANWRISANWRAETSDRDELTGTI